MPLGRTCQNVNTLDVELYAPGFTDPKSYSFLYRFTEAYDETAIIKRQKFIVHYILHNANYAIQSILVSIRD